MKTSEKTDQVLGSLLKAKAGIGAVAKDKKNDFHKSKYADINSFLEVVEPALVKEGLVLLQPTGKDEYGPFVETKIFHASSGQFISSRVDLILTKNDMQGLGSAVTYARRYSLQSLLALQADDDDGNGASGHPLKAAPTKPKEIPNHAPKAKAVEPEVMSIADELVGFGKNKDLPFREVPMQNLLALEEFIHKNKIDNPKALQFLELFTAYKGYLQMEEAKRGIKL